MDESFAPEGWVSTGADEKKDKVDLDAIDEDNKDNVEATSEGSLPPVFGSQSAVR